MSLIPLSESLENRLRDTTYILCTVALKDEKHRISSEWLLKVYMDLKPWSVSQISLDHVIPFQIPNAMLVTDAAILVIGVTPAAATIGGRICGMTFGNDGALLPAMVYDPAIAGMFASLCCKSIPLMSV